MRTVVGDNRPLPRRSGVASSAVCSSRMCAGASSRRSRSPRCGTRRRAITDSYDIDVVARRVEAVCTSQSAKNASTVIDGRVGASAVSSSTRNRRSAAAASAFVRNPPRHTCRRPRASSATQAAKAQPLFRRITVAHASVRKSAASTPDATRADREVGSRASPFSSR